MSELVEGELVPARKAGGRPPSHRAEMLAMVAARRARALELKLKGYSYDQLVTLVGYPTRAAAAMDISRALKERQKARDAAADAYVEAEISRLEALLTRVHEVMDSRHYYVANGKVAVRITKYATDDAGNILLDEDSNPLAEQVEELVDDGPVLAAVDRAIKISESLRKLQGLDKQVTKIDVSGTVQHAYGVEIEEV